MTSYTYIDLNLSEVNCAVVVYAKQNDRLSRHIVATLYDGASPWTPPAGSYPMIRFLKPDGTSGFYDVDENEDPATTISGNVVTMTIVEQALTVPGDVYMELNFYNADVEKLTTLKWLLRVQKSVLEDSTIISTDYYNILSAQIAGLLGATTHPPIIDSGTKNWMLWDEDTGAYVDSGYSSVGTQGPDGPQGVSISSVTKASGTGAPGTTDTYNVNLSNSTVGGTFTVYNGSDGAGSPGTQLPLMDGTAAVGTAAAFAHEDHVHPTDTSRQASITASGILKGAGGGSVSAATKGTDFGALSFTVTLGTTWTGNAQTVSNANFLASGYAYIVSPASGSFSGYAASQIYADDVSTDGSMTFHCSTAPAAQLTVNIVRVVSA